MIRKSVHEQLRAAIESRGLLTTRRPMKNAKVAARAMPPTQVGSIQAGTPAAPLLDTIENLILRQHLVPMPKFQSLMGWTSPQSVTRALRAHRIFAVDLEGQRYFPVLFADPMYSRRHLAAVTKQLCGLPADAKIQFLGSRKGSLGGQTPLEALATGRLKTVLQLAAAYAET